MCYTNIQPTLSKVGLGMGELCFVYPLGAQIIPCLDSLPFVFAREAHLVIHLPPMRGASLGRVSVLNVESTRLTYVPIRKLLYNV